jgi:hypothetical protein
LSDFDTLRVKVGRRPIVVVEIDLDYCQNFYGTLPCTAVLNTTGSQKCFNTFKTCQALAAFDRGTKTYRFCSNNAFLPIGENMIPCVTGFDIGPTQLKPEALSVSPSVSISFQDFTHHDRGVDPYPESRSYNAMGQGSFFGKLRARNPYLANRVMRVCTGYVDNDRVIYTQPRTYFIDHLEGPDANGKVKLVGKDPLRFADNEKNEAPVSSKGTLEFAVSVSDDVLALLPVGVGETYPTSGTVRVGDELIVFSSRMGDNLIGLSRGSDGTTSAEHDVNDKVQLCLRFTNQTIPSILSTLLTEYGSIDASHIPIIDWEGDNENWLGNFTSTVLLSEPEGLKDLVDDILECTGSTMWWDEIAAEIKWKVIVPYLIKEDVTIWSDAANILAGSLTVKDLEKERLSRVITYLSTISQIEDVKRSNFHSIVIQVDTDSESDNAYGISLKKEILNRWVPTESYASALGDRLIYRLRLTPREISLQIDAKDADVKVGDLRDVQSRMLQDESGDDGLVRCMVTEIEEKEVGTTYQVKLLQVAPRGGIRAALIADNSQADWTSASDVEKRTYMFISNDSGFMSDGEPGPRIS